MRIFSWVLYEVPELQEFQEISFSEIFYKFVLIFQKPFINIPINATSIADVR
jgi:hypothetical protein